MRGDHPARGSATDDAEATAVDVLFAVRERLRDVSAVYEFAVDALEWLEDVESAEDATELFDAMGVLGDALDSAPTAAKCGVRDVEWVAPAQHDAPPLGECLS